ncbi:MAG: SDR family oxidoreductase [Gammaproteobacteria bacterium]|nr:SDR family oxidoreductase [Gammaproteobacteria bacterium]
MLLKDKVSIISGVGPGMGGELAVLAAEEGAKVVLAARTEANLQQFEAAIDGLNLGTETLAVVTDITDARQCQGLVDQALAKFGRIDCLFNNAFHPGSFDSVEYSDFQGWREALDVNLFGSLSMSQKVIPAMKEQGGGAIVMINTMATRKPMATQAGYAASKAALSSATAHLAQEVGPHGIRVNSTYIGWMWGPGVEMYCTMMAQSNDQTVEQVRAEVAKSIALGDIPEDRDCAKAAILLASDYAAAITGASLDVNGGEYFAH